MGLSNRIINGLGLFIRINNGMGLSNRIINGLGLCTINTTSTIWSNLVMSDLD